MKNFDEFLTFAKSKSGQAIPTIGGRSIFSVTFEKNTIVYTPTSTGKARRQSIPTAQKVFALHEETHSKSPVTYLSISRNSSYILALIRLYELERLSSNSAETPQADSYAVIVENDDSAWQDQTGRVYHFPKRYRTIIPPGTLVIYYKGKIRDQQYLKLRLTGEPHYFAVARIGKHTPDPLSTKGDWYAKVVDYVPFEKPVPIKNPDGSYIESIPQSRATNYWRDGVRAIDRNTFSEILGPSSQDFTLISRGDQLNDIEQGLTSSIEGGKRQIFTTIYERDPRLREEAIRIHGTVCAACSFDFGKFYGVHGKGFIHIHHRKPISEAGGPIAVDPGNDLIPLCANCHAMAHRKKNEVLSLEQLIELIAH